MIVFGNSTNLRYQSPSAALLHKPKPNTSVPSSDPQYDSRGWHKSRDQTSFQRVELDQQRTGKHRVEEWVQSQMQSSPLLSLPETRPQQSPSSRRRSLPRRTAKAYVSSPLSSSCITCESDLKILYTVPEDSEEHTDAYILSAPTPTYPSSTPRRARHRRQLSDLDDIVEEDD